jgi:hypothetical protein
VHISILIILIFLKLIALCRVARMHSWSDKIGDGLPGYSAILQAVPDINKKYYSFIYLDLSSLIIFYIGFCDLPSYFSEAITLPIFLGLILPSYPLDIWGKPICTSLLEVQGP